MNSDSADDGEDLDNETTEEIVDEEVESTDNDIQTEDDDPQLEPQENIQPDPPEKTGGSPTGPGGYIGRDKRPIAV